MILVRRFVVGALLLVATLAPARAAEPVGEIESPEVQLGLRKYAALDFQGAIASLEGALAETLTRAEKIVAYRTLGLALAALGRTDAARERFIALLRLSPTSELDRSVAPRMRALFEEARSRVATEGRSGGADGVLLPAIPVELRPPGPREGESVVIAGAHRGGRARRVSLFVRTAGKAAFERVDGAVSADGAFALTLAGKVVRPPALELYAVLGDDEAVPVARVGSLAEPIRLAVRGRPVPVWKRGWFWGMLGGIVAAGAVATTLGLVLTRDGGSPQATVTVLPK